LYGDEFRYLSLPTTQKGTAKASDYEAILLQRLQDLEARDVFARIHGAHLALAPEEQPNVTPVDGFSVPNDQQETSGSPNAEVLDLDEEELDEYEEYR
jgi:hypothetical protein